MARLLTFFLLAALIACQIQTPTPTSIALVGTYTRKEGHVDGKGAGIYIFRQEDASGNLEQLSLTAGVVNPSFLVVSHDQRFVYAVEEIGPDVDSVGRIVAYAWNGDTLRKLNQQSSHAFAPCHLTTDQKGRYLFVANYVGGVVAMLPIANDGSLRPASTVFQLTGSGPHPRQEASHPHSVNISPDERFLYVPDLGADHIYIFEIDYEDGKLLPAKSEFSVLRPGAGPRHLAFHPTMPYAYVINELNSTITALQWTPATGALDTLQTLSTLPDNFQGDNLCSDIHVTPNGQFLYGANRGHNSLAGYRIDPSSGKLALIGHTPTKGDFPRNFAITPNGRWVYAANQNTDNIVVFDIQEDGKLRYRREVKIPTPVCIQFLE